MANSKQASCDSTLARHTSEFGLNVDFGFLTAQAAGDLELERDLLQLFVAQARRLVPRLPAMTPREQAETAHLLKGSCQGIGAVAAAEAAQQYEDAGPQTRDAAYRRLADAFAAADTAIEARLASLAPLASEARLESEARLASI